jgi:hypothetical protein
MLELHRGSSAQVLGKFEGDSSELIRINFRYAVKFSYHRAAQSLVMIV